MLNNSARTTMNLSRCPDVTNQLPSYIEGELTAVESVRVKGHLEICRACRTEEQILRSALGALQTRVPISAPQNVYVRFSEKAARYDASPWRRPATARWAATACCLFLVVGVGAMVRQANIFGGKERPAAVAVNPEMQAAPPRQVAENTMKTANTAPNQDHPTVVPIPEEPTVQRNAISNNGDLQTAALVREKSHRTRSNHTGNGSTQVAQSNITEFLSIRATDGRSAADIISAKQRFAAERAASASQTLSEPLHKNQQPRLANIPSAPGVKMLVPENDVQVQVGNKVTNIHKDTGYDSRGELALIRIKTDSDVKIEEK